MMVAVALVWVYLALARLQLSPAAKKSVLAVGRPEPETFFPLVLRAVMEEDETD